MRGKMNQSFVQQLILACWALQQNRHHHRVKRLTITNTMTKVLHKQVVMFIHPKSAKEIHRLGLVWHPKNEQKGDWMLYKSYIECYIISLHLHQPWLAISALSSTPPKRWAPALQIGSAKAFLVQQHLQLLLGIASIDLAGGSFPIDR